MWDIEHIMDSADIENIFKDLDITNKGYLTCNEIKDFYFVISGYNVDSIVVSTEDQNKDLSMDCNILHDLLYFIYKWNYK